MTTPKGYKKDGTPANASGKGGFGERPEDINCGGLTEEQKANRAKARDINAENGVLAAELQAKLLLALEDDMSREGAEILDHIRGDVLRLIDSAMDRHYGKAIQHVKQDTTVTEVPKGNDAFYADSGEDDE